MHDFIDIVKCLKFAELAIFIYMIELFSVQIRISVVEYIYHGKKTIIR